MSANPTTAASRLARKNPSRSATGLTQARPKPTTRERRTSPKAIQRGFMRLMTKKSAKKATAPSVATSSRCHSCVTPAITTPLTITAALSAYTSVLGSNRRVRSQ